MRRTLTIASTTLGLLMGAAVFDRVALGDPPGETPGCEFTLHNGSTFHAPCSECHGKDYTGWLCNTTIQTCLRICNAQGQVVSGSCTCVCLELLNQGTYGNLEPDCPTEE